MVTVEIVSFGYGHGPAPENTHLTVDVRHHFRDPHINPALRGLTAHDTAVIDTVLATPGVAHTIRSVTDTVHGFLAGPTPGPVRVAVGCVGGRHRSAVIADQVADRLRRGGVDVTVTHRDLARPVLARKN
jgi:RNase adaptor protein for sRNA GlmZ degradation